MKAKGEKKVKIEVLKNCRLKGEAIIVCKKNKDGKKVTDTKVIEVDELDAANMIRAGKAKKVGADEKAA